MLKYRWAKYGIKLMTHNSSYSSQFMYMSVCYIWLPSYILSGICDIHNIGHLFRIFIKWPFVLGIWKQVPNVWLQVIPRMPLLTHLMEAYAYNPDIKAHGTYMGPIRGRQDPGRPHVGPMSFAIWEADFRFAPSQWETALLCNDVFRWLGASLESALHHIYVSEAVIVE